VILRQFFEPGLAQYAYLVGCAATGEALVIDPHIAIDEYQRAAAAEGLRITAVAETHVHADFVSGAPALARATGATLYVSGEGDPRWRATYTDTPRVRALNDGDSFVVGSIRIDVRHTPGHTPEHLIFVVTDQRVATSPLGIFSGDLLFVGDVGRPDLLESAVGERGSKREAARQLFGSLRSLANLPDRTLVWPGHGSGSACGKNLGGVPVTTLGYEQLTNWGLASQDEEAFVTAVLRDQPDPPMYFAEMKRSNRVGAPAWRDDKALPDLSEEVVHAAHRGERILIDVRDGDHALVDDALVVPWGRQFHAWAGSVVPPGVSLVLIADEEAIARQARRALALIGRRLVDGWITGTLASRVLPTHTLDTPSELPAGNRVIDVRSTAEWRAGHLPDALHVPLARLGERLDTFDFATPIVVYCQAGTRARVAAAALLRVGATVSSLEGGLDGYRRRQALTGGDRRTIM
jgi:hydroxyacylglutathione hydrolase